MRSTSIKEYPLNDLKCPQLQQIFDRYGRHVLHPKFLTIQTEEGAEL